MKFIGWTQVKEFVIGAVILAAFAWSFFFILSGLRDVAKDRRASLASADRSLEALNRAASDAQKKVDEDDIAFFREVERRLETLERRQSGTGGLTPEDRVVLDKALEGQRKIIDRLTALEGALVNEPVKALAVPLLKKDVDDLTDRSKLHETEISRQTDRLDGIEARITTITTGVLGLILTTIAAVVGLFTYLANRSKKPSSDWRFGAARRRS